MPQHVSMPRFLFMLALIIGGLLLVGFSERLAQQFGVAPGGGPDSCQSIALNIRFFGLMAFLAGLAERIIFWIEASANKQA